jgi:hypothetical protein
LTLLALIVAVYAALPFQSLNTSAANTFLDKVVTVLAYDLRIPVYLVIITLVIVLLYILFLRRRYLPQLLTLDFLSGRWKNTWGTPGNGGSEIALITKRGEYFVDDVQRFTVEDFKYDPTKKTVTFIKVGLTSWDNRKLLNTLTLENNELLVGTEQGYPIRYAKLP